MRTTSRRLVTALCGSLALVGPSLAVAQDAAPATAAPKDTRPLPTAEAIHAKMIEFMGGPEAFAEIGPVKSIGTFSIPAMQMTGPIRTFSAPPNKMRVEVDMPGVGSTLTVFDGTVGWSLDPVRGASLMDGEMLEQIRQEADPRTELELLKRADSVAVTGRETFEGVECVVLHIVRGKAVEDRFIVEATGEFKGRRAKTPSPMGEIPAETVNDGWKMIGERRVPARTIIRTMGIEQVMTIDEIVEGDLPADTFAQSPAIQALVAERAAKAEAAKSSDGAASSNSSSTSESKTSSSSSSASDSKKSSSSSSSSKKSGSSSGSRKSGSSSSGSSRGGGS